MVFSSRKPTVEMETFRNDLLELLRKHAGHLDSSETLALCAYTAGQIMAMMDGRKYTTEVLLDLVSKNLEEGNRDAILSAAKWMPSA